MKPFEYGLAIKWVYEGGIFSPDVLKITDAVLMASFSAGVGKVAALSLGAGFPTDASFPHTMTLAIKNVVAAWDEFDATGESGHVLGVLRFAASAPRQRWVAQRVREAIAFVADGSVPRRLAQ